MAKAEAGYFARQTRWRPIHDEAAGRSGFRGARAGPGEAEKHPY